MSKTKLLAAILLLCFTVSYGRADTIITNPGPGTVANSAGNNTLGFDFTVGAAPLLVTALGLWDFNQDGFANPHTVGLWDNSGKLLGSVLISPGTIDPISNQFRYATLVTPVTLLAGTTYVLGASYLQNDADADILNFSGDQATFDPAVAAGNGRGAAGSGFAFPSQNDGFGSFVGPDAQFTFVSSGVPDTGSTLGLLAVALAALIGASRLRSLRLA